MRFFSAWILVLALGLLLGCPSKDFREPGVRSVSGGDTDRWYRPADLDQIWKITKDALDENGYAIADSTKGKKKALIVTDWLLGTSDRLYSGYGDSRIPYRIRFKFTIKLKSSANRVNVEIDSREQYMTDAISAGGDFTGSLYKWIHTRSSGRKEEALLKDIGRILDQSAAKKGKKK